MEYRLFFMCLYILFPAILCKCFFHSYQNGTQPAHQSGSQQKSACASTTYQTLYTQSCVFVSNDFPLSLFYCFGSIDCLCFWSQLASHRCHVFDQCPSPYPRTGKGVCLQDFDLRDTLLDLSVQ
ncbi:hypothetical protein VTN96DRAFT_1918 [Rasamsonia emersonii]